MPTKRKTQRRKYKRSRKSFKQKVRDAMITISENRFHDLSHGTTISTTMEIKDAFQTSQGDEDTKRQGDSVLLKSIYLRIHLAGNAAGDDNQFVRFFVIQWYDNSVPLAGSLLQSTAAGSAIDSDFLTDNIRKKKTFKVLYDKRICLQLNGHSGHVYAHKMKGFDRQINYASAGITPIYGSLYFCIVSDQTTNLPEYNVYMRTQWIDP